MLQKSKSKKIFQLKYLLLVPLVFGMLAYTSIEAVESKDVSKQQTTEDAALIAEINKEIAAEVAKTGSLKKVFYKWKDMYNDPSVNGGILTKEMYFKQEIISERLYEMYRDSLKKAKAPFFTSSKSIKKKIPSTARYESYVQHTKAFQLLDKNLQYSIENRFQNGGTSIKLLNINSNFSKGLLVYKVKTIKDLTGDEVRTFNTRMSEIFESKTSQFKGLVLTDGRYSFEVFDLDLGESVTIENSVDKKSEVISFGQVENVPVFPGCESDADKRGCFFESMRNHIRKHFNYPKEAQEKGIQGRVNSMFIIDEDGNIIDAKFRGPDSLLTTEAKRIISRLPKMQPGEHKGKKVQVAFSIPITFKLASNKLTQEAPPKNYDQASYVPFSVIDEVPVFPGCEGAEDKRRCFNEKIMAHISKNFNYPQAAQDAGIQGMVNVILTIDKNGSVKNLKTRGPDALLENETKRIMGLLPTMKPGKQKGKSVDVPFSIPISFRLDHNADETAGWKLDTTNKKEERIGDDTPLFMVDGNEYIKKDFIDFEKSNPDSIKLVNVIKGDAAIEKYGERAKNGVVEVVTKEKSLLTGNIDENPIYIVNGVEATKKHVVKINPDKIESINVLKDKMATDKYGEKGKNGVVEITLKKRN